MKTYIKIMWDKGVIAIGGGVVIILAIIDYSINFGLFKFILKYIISPMAMLVPYWPYLLGVIIIVWITLLTTKLRRITLGETRMVPEDRLQKDEKDIEAIRNNIIKNNSALKEELTKIRERLNKLEDENYDIKRETLKIEIERYEKKGQNGAITCRIDLLELDMIKGFDYMIHETLEDILVYVRGHTLFSQSAAELKEQLAKLPAKYDPIRGQIEAAIKI